MYYSTVTLNNVLKDVQHLKKAAELLCSVLGYVEPCAPCADKPGTRLVVLPEELHRRLLVYAGFDDSE